MWVSNIFQLHPISCSLDISHDIPLVTDHVHSSLILRTAPGSRLDQGVVDRQIHVQAWWPIAVAGSAKKINHGMGVSTNMLDKMGSINSY